MTLTPLPPADRLLLQHRGRWRALQTKRLRYKGNPSTQNRRTLRAAIRDYTHLIAAYLDA